MPGHITGTAGLGAYIVLGQDATCRQYQGEALGDALISRHILANHKLTQTMREAMLMHNRCAFRALWVARPL